MKLYELPRRSFFKFEKDINVLSDEIYLFDKIDGMYSICYNIKRNIIHFKATTEVEKIDKPDYWDTL